MGSGVDAYQPVGVELVTVVTDVIVARIVVMRMSTGPGVLHRGACGTMTNATRYGASAAVWRGLCDFSEDALAGDNCRRAKRYLPCLCEETTPGRFIRQSLGYALDEFVHRFLPFLPFRVHSEFSDTLLNCITASTDVCTKRRHDTWEYMVLCRIRDRVAAKQRQQVLVAADKALSDENALLIV